MPTYSVLQFFRPTDQEIVGLILHNLLIENQPLTPPLDAIIRGFNPFGSNLEPAKIWAKYGGDQLVDQDLYFLADIKAKNRSRINRKVGSNGTWSQGEISKRVELDGNPKPIGLKRKFRFEDENSDEDGAWFIDEYSLFDGRKKQNGYKTYDFDFVICRMRKNGKVVPDVPKSKKSSKNKKSKKKKKSNKKNPRKRMRKDYDDDDDDDDEDDDDDDDQVIESQEESSSQTMNKVAADEDHQMSNWPNSGVEYASDVVDLIQSMDPCGIADPESFDNFVPNTTFDVVELLAGFPSTMPNSDLGDGQVVADDQLKSFATYGIDLDSVDNFIPNTSSTFFDVGDFLDGI